MVDREILRGKNNRWYAQIGVNNNTILLGCFKTKEEAITAREQAEDKYYGEYSYRNSMKFAEDNGL